MSIGLKTARNAQQGSAFGRKRAGSRQPNHGWHEHIALGHKRQQYLDRQMPLPYGSTGKTATTTARPTVFEVLRSPGQPLDAETRAFFEPRFGHNFSTVRIHTDAKAAESARAVNALAYTAGNHIVFGARGYAPKAEPGKYLLAHELTHTIQQQIGSGDSRLTIMDSFEHEREADMAAAAICSGKSIATLRMQASGSIARQKLGPDEPPPPIEHSFELPPHLIPMEGFAAKEEEKCEEFPGGSTDCEVDEKTGIPTGKVKQQIDEKNPCSRPCVEQHEAVHVKQMKAFCPKLRDCYLAADKGKGSALECAKMAIFGSKERECEAYKVSLPCVEKRLKSARECQSKENKEYGTRKLASERCFHEKYCGAP
jgi:hypothetical protein